MTCECVYHPKEFNTTIEVVSFDISLWVCFRKSLHSAYFRQDLQLALFSRRWYHRNFMAVYKGRKNNNRLTVNNLQNKSGSDRHRLRPIFLSGLTFPWGRRRISDDP